MLDARMKEMKLADKKEKRKDNCVIYVPKKYSGNWGKFLFISMETDYQNSTSFFSDFDHVMANI